jgi:phosphotransferase system HPr (HPr) family protein
VAEGKAKVRNSAGIHVRPSGEIRNAFCNYPGKIILAAKGLEIELQNTLGLIALGLQENDTVAISVDGPEDEIICAELIALLEKQFDFSPNLQ